jgi:hypothetical protein
MDMPPWMIGIFAMNEPILSSGSFIQASWSVVAIWRKNSGLLVNIRIKMQKNAELSSVCQARRPA